ncbi:MAG: FtsX-like permease family protein [Vicinamibacterales bacterium]
MMLVWLLSWPYARKHAMRTVLTVTAVTMGVAVFVAMHSANRAVLAGFRETIDRIAGATQLQITAGEAGFAEDVLERVQALPQVRVAAPIIEAIVGTALPGQGNLLLLGVDMTGDRSLREYDLAEGDELMLDDPLMFLAQPDSIMISASFAERNGLKSGDRVPLETTEGTKPFTVRGVLRTGGLTSAFGGNLAVMDVYAAQFVFGRGRTFDRIDLAVTTGVDVDETRRTLQQELGSGFEVQTPSTRGQSFESMLRIYRFMLNFSSAFAVLVGMFIIHNAFATAVTQRRTEIGLLRALGATRAQVSALFLVESLVIGLIGTAAGLWLGQLAATGLAAASAALIQGVYGVGQSPLSVTLTPGMVGLAVGVGLATSGVAALLPARLAARVDPVRALQKGGHQVLASGTLRGRAIGAGLTGVLGLGLFVGSEGLPGFYAGYLFILVSALLMTPVFALGLTRALRPLLAWVRPVEGALAADSLVGAPGRTSSTVAALMLSLALVIGLAGTARGSYARISEWVDTALNPDLFVTGSPTLTDHTFRFPDAMTAELQATGGIAEVQRMRRVRIHMNNQPILLNVVEMEKTARRSPRQAVAGDVDAMFRVAAAGRGVIASENFASLQHVQVGDRIVVPSPDGPLDLPVVGVIRDYSDQQGALFIDRDLFMQHWHDDTVDFFRVYVQSGVAAERVRDAILQRFAGHRRLFVLSNHEVRGYVMRLTDQWFSMTWAQLLVAIVVAILGVVNSLTVSVADRRRELGILRAVGGLPHQVRWAIQMEAVTIAVVSVVLGLAVGALHLYCVLEMTSRDFPGLTFDYTYPVAVAASLLPIILLTAAAGAAGPAEEAVRSSLVEALEYE